MRAGKSVLLSYWPLFKFDPQNMSPHLGLLPWFSTFCLLASLSVLLSQVLTSTYALASLILSSQLTFSLGHRCCYLRSNRHSCLWFYQQWSHLQDGRPAPNISVAPRRLARFLLCNVPRTYICVYIHKSARCCSCCSWRTRRRTGLCYELHSAFSAKW